jgi:hypothetical protein
MFNTDFSMEERIAELHHIQGELQNLELRPRGRTTRRSPLRERAATNRGKLLDELRTHVPFISQGFQSSDDDIVAILTALSAARGTGYSTSAASAEGHSNKVAELEAEVKQLTTRLQRRTEEVERLRDDLGEARSRAKAVEEQSRMKANVLSLRREETKKHLLTEESRTAKLQHQNKLLQQEVDRLKGRVHDLMR